MIIAAREQVRFALPDPLFPFVALTLRAVPVSAGVVADGEVSAAVARIDMSAQS
ncbi:hypothetical protein SDC9_110337 [bioreactor metagenome]|uniref:Uncharacterized protein n=1 Tax=bioreactor metagenome TaxID=1076179 RepID=A0A645BDP7_9ZZZZ